MLRTQAGGVAGAIRDGARSTEERTRIEWPD
jgi:hypothetical protein